MFLFVLVDDYLYMPSSIYDSIRAIKRASVLFFWVNTSSPQYLGAILLTKRLFVYILCPHKMNVKWLFVYMSGNKKSTWKAAWSCVLFKLINSPFGQLRFRFGFSKILTIPVKHLFFLTFYAIVHVSTDFSSRDFMFSPPIPIYI